MVAIRTGEFRHEGFRLVYSDYGSGTKPFVLIPGLLLPRAMHDPLARTLAERGNRVITLDPLGHGESDRPADMWRYTMSLLAEQVVGLMDHLELEEAVVGGTSLGANITLETCVLAPDRVRGAVIEMPVLDNALLGCAIAFAPLLVYLTAGLPVARVVSSLIRLVPRTPSELLNVGLDWAGQDPKPSGAYLQGLAAPCRARLGGPPQPALWWPPPWRCSCTCWARAAPEGPRPPSSSTACAPLPPRPGARSRAFRPRAAHTRPDACTTRRTHR